MALVMLPCELPWWPQVQRLLSQLQDGATVESLVRVLTSIHALCNVGLDPDEEGTVDLQQFSGLASFLTDHCEESERKQILECALPCMVRYALRLKELKPPGGLHFSLQQQADSVTFDRKLSAALLGHAFFSSFPKRSFKTHPTLLDYNFSHFFKHLHLPSQQAKFRSMMHYFCLLSKTEPLGSMKISRKVLSSARWLTVEDWLESMRPLCPLLVRHQPRPERAPEPSAVLVTPSSPHVGRDVLNEGFNPECRLLAVHPEALATLLFVEALEDNETLLVEGACKPATFNPLPPHFQAAAAASWSVPGAQLLSFADPEDFSALPSRQFEEDNVLRELNKLLLACEAASGTGGGVPYKVNNVSSCSMQAHSSSSRRLSPIGESFSSTPPETSTTNSVVTAFSKAKTLLRVSSSERAGRFIALGSSGELLPISRNDLPSSHPRLCGPRHSLLGAGPTALNVPLQSAPAPPLPAPSVLKRGGSRQRKQTSNELGSSSEDEEEEFHSAKESLDLSEEAGVGQSHELDTPQRRCSFAQRLREALRREASAIGVLQDAHNMNDLQDSSSSSSEPDNSSLASSEQDLLERKFKRQASSCGFALPEDHAAVLIRSKEALQAPARWLGRAFSKTTGESVDDSVVSQRNSDYSSDLDELYEQFSKWLEHDRAGEEEAQEELVHSFARGLLTRTLSDCGTSNKTCTAPTGVSRSLSEAAGTAESRGHHAPRRLAAHLSALLGGGPGPRPVATGAWWVAGTGTDPQFKAVLQWLAASQAGSSCLVYYTDGIPALAKLDTLCRVLVDRQWSVGELTGAVLRYAQTILESEEDHTLSYWLPKRTLFDELLGTDKPEIAPETEL